MGKVRAVCISAEKGTAKHNVDEAELLARHGLKGDAHAGDWHRQVSLLSYQAIKDFGADVEDGAFGENIVAEDIDLKNLPLGSKLHCGTAILEITQIGKECHNPCEISKRMGDCIMPREGIFAKVIQAGKVKTGDAIHVE